MWGATRPQPLQGAGARGLLMVLHCGAVGRGWGNVPAAVPRRLMDELNEYCVGLVPAKTNIRSLAVGAA